MTVRSPAAQLRKARRPSLALAAEAALTLAVMSLLVRFTPFRRLVATEACGSTQQRKGVDVVGLASVIRAVSRRVPFRAKCLEQALALRSMLRRRGIGSVLHYGIRRDISGLSAHAWLSVGGEPVIGGENSGDFAEVAAFGTDRHG